MRGRSREDKNEKRRPISRIKRKKMKTVGEGRQWIAQEQQILGVNKDVWGSGRVD